MHIITDPLLYEQQGKPATPMTSCHHPPLWLLLQPSGPHLNIKTSFPRYEDSNVKDKTVVRQSYIHHGDPCTGKMSSLYWDGPRPTISYQRIATAPTSLLQRLSLSVVDSHSDSDMFIWHNSTKLNMDWYIHSSFGTCFSSTVKFQSCWYGEPHKGMKPLS